ncbi:uncharacterized protein L969DRAFT_97226 [Mixia osmundae IAM 14324]|uniref:FMN hydroxy acid dehydrogenase domain-containing protein n=1 Tax=Mixia osmundae (strain CBS 9802 / IAM 14324 / JCM 22182 / KY 12970) TaxID=764103 RepID=G7DW05_MIXOS|nr:uncharacterized protein L969DRAFT_97226 [Mixia osmundae IAM 14324]KEI36489.1 hypothetical protein L969DRAFT_97226 [Mixia osmundae IAM 14324]GAA94811.1 hypothetical protein E5Q_01465 [Mixia osmundae IAM 14324]
MDPDGKSIEKHYSLYQREQFLKGTRGETSIVSAQPTKLQAATKEKLTDKGYLYAVSNAGEGWTDQANRQAFFNWKIIPRMLVDTNERDLSVDLFGHKLPNPLLFAPIGINSNYHPDAELIPARVAGELGMGYCLSTAASRSIEDVAKANGNGPRFFQLYWPHDPEITTSLLTRAHKSGYDACILTVDTWQLGWRPTDIDVSNYSFYYGKTGNQMGTSDPAFMKKYGKELEKDPSRWIDKAVWHGKAHSWKELPALIKEWKKISGDKPFLLKGIQSTEDALKAVEYGCDGIVVSNHAGRQVDGALGSLDALAEIAPIVGDKLTIIYDSGVRTGADVFKAIALGAKAVLFGRLWIFGMSAGGYEGCMHVTKCLLADLDILMTVGGFPSLRDITRKSLKRVEGVMPEPPAAKL